MTQPLLASTQECHRLSSRRRVFKELSGNATVPVDDFVAFDANEGPSKLVLLPFRPLLGDLGASWTTKLKCSSRRRRRPNSATGSRPLSGLGFAPSKLTVMRRTVPRAFIFLPFPCRLRPNRKIQCNRTWDRRTGFRSHDGCLFRPKSLKFQSVDDDRMTVW